MIQNQGVKCVALILAAGNGSRMSSVKPKVVQDILGSPLISYVLSSVEPLFDTQSCIVVGDSEEMVRAACTSSSVKFIRQDVPLGTGHAVQVALPVLQSLGVDRILIVNGDAPAVTTDLLSNFIAEAEGCDLAFATVTLDMPGSYGRVIRENGEIVSIIEQKDFDSACHGEDLKEVNAGVYMMKLDLALTLLPKIENKNNSQEYYITDMVSLAIRSGASVKGISFGEDVRLLGVNTPLELSYIESALRDSIVKKFLLSGVVIHNPEQVCIGPFVSIDPGVEVYGPCEIYGNSKIASGAVIFSHCWIKDTVIHEGVQVNSFCHLEGATIGGECFIGPYARLRPGVFMDSRVCIGNFVEAKKVKIGSGTKANHLSYLGDAVIGENVNIGAGVITCNYDGVNKHETTIGKGAFIGSNTALVAPISIGDEALVGAGSVITHSVGKQTLALTRSKQKSFIKKANKQ